MFTPNTLFKALRELNYSHLKLRRNTSTPAKKSFSSISNVLDAGPTVATYAQKGKREKMEEHEKEVQKKMKEFEEEEEEEEERRREERY